MKHRRMLQWILLGVGVLALTATVTLFLGYRQVTQQPQVILDQLQKKADMHLSRVRQTATKQGVREWHLDAQSATLIEGRQTMLVVKPEVEFFMQNGETVYLTAEQGKIHTESSAMHVSGQVSVDNGHYRLRTESLEYDPVRRELRSATPVTLSGDAFTLRSDRVTLDLETNITHFEGNVEGSISEADLEL